MTKVYWSKKITKVIRYKEYVLDMNINVTMMERMRTGYWGTKKVTQLLRYIKKEKKASIKKCYQIIKVWKLLPKYNKC